MAAVVAAADMTVLKNTQILVTVEEALADILVVSYIREDKQFQGVLLDSTKRNLPFGVSALHPAFFPQQKCTDGGDDRLHSASQRFAYRDGERVVRPIGRSKAGQRKDKMTVRLRPRKVLCSKCEGICNENSENVARTDGRTRPRKEPDAESGKTDPGGGIAPVKGPAGRTLIPKLSRLRPSEITRALNGGESWSMRNAERDDRRQDVEEPIDSVIARGNSDAEMESQSIGTRVLHPVGAAKRKRRADGGEESAGGLFAGARTLKISYGEGEETVTVLRLPTTADGSGEESVGIDSGRTSKAARKALKKAKKLARKPPSPCADRAPQRRHKRKAKHKKRRKGDKDGRSDSDSLSLEGENGNGIERVEDRDEGNGGKSWDSVVVDGSATSESASESSLEAGRETDRVEGEENNLEEGDVVWGKLRGHPWWPGRVVSLHQKGERDREALVSWYASEATSHLPANRLTPFLASFQERYDKKKKGPYKDAVKQASDEAQGGESLDPLASVPDHHFPHQYHSPSSL